jgi:hypothetical protein
MLRAQYTIMIAEKLQSWLRRRMRGPTARGAGPPCSRDPSRAVPAALSKRSHLNLKNDRGPHIFLDTRVYHGIKRETFTTPAHTGLALRMPAQPKAPTEVVVDKEPADEAPTFLPLLRDCKKDDFPIW